MKLGYRDKTKHHEQSTNKTVAMNTKIDNQTGGKEKTRNKIQTEGNPGGGD
jgi:hypothetical protein